MNESNANRTQRPRSGGVSDAVDESVIRAVVDNFYAAARQDPLLSPVFDAHVKDWGSHLETMYGFWAKVLRGERRYSGDPFGKHQSVASLRQEHFERWLDLFAETLKKHCSGQDSSIWEGVARRMGFAMCYRLGLGQPNELLPRAPGLFNRGQRMTDHNKSRAKAAPDSGPEDGAAATIPQDPSITFDLTAEAAQLRQVSSWRERGLSSRTLLKRAELRLVMIALKPDGHINKHKTDRRVAVQTLAGHVRLNLPEETIDLPSGRILVMERGVPHDVTALQDSTILLSLSGAADSRK